MIGIGKKQDRSDRLLLHSHHPFLISEFSLERNICRVIFSYSISLGFGGGGGGESC